MAIRTLRQALDHIQDLLDGKSYSAELWDVLVALRGPDSRDKKLKYATTAVIRQSAFPRRPCEERSIFGTDSEKLAERRRGLFRNREDNNHFREHVRDAFAALGLTLLEDNNVGNQKDLRPTIRRKRRGSR